MQTANVAALQIAVFLALVCTSYTHGTYIHFIGATELVRVLSLPPSAVPFHAINHQAFLLSLSPIQTGAKAGRTDQWTRSNLKRLNDHDSSAGWVMGPISP